MSHDISLVFPRSKFLLHEDTFPPLGILYLAATLKKADFKVQVLDFGLGHNIDQIDSNIVGISFTSPQRGEAFTLAKELKNRGKVILGGGAHPTHMPEECRKNGFDYVFKGEADVVLPVFLFYHMNPKPQIDFPIVCGTEYDNIDAFPYPDRDSLPIKNYHYEIDGIPATTIMTSRGCPFSCSFCGKLTKKFRVQSAERTIDEIEYLYERYGFQAFMIFDDVFIADKKRLKTISDFMKNRRYSFRCFGRANLLTKDVCEMLKTMNVVEVGIGIESGSDTILKNAMKGTTRTMNTQAVENLKSVGIRAKAFLIVGLPGESEATFKETERWIKETQPFDVDCSVFQPMPGSVVFKKPQNFDVNFDYNHCQLWYKGTPGLYSTTSHTQSLTSERILEMRDYLENKYKRKEFLR